ncbi:hypothetical protein AVEN_257613-1 [Araneus ventricosus]|uniref:Uncharacterized protein n=1 Tax=Araneus ventricosus TaxID=182803 RepID=A0A4Y2E5T3_ARAVE|nr:hypothetical protein AVEN_257613-1 [Araneus ventricosus]
MVAKNCHPSLLAAPLTVTPRVRDYNQGSTPIAYRASTASPLKTFPTHLLPEQLECVSFHADKQNSVHLVTDCAITPRSCKQNHEKTRKVGAANL